MNNKHLLAYLRKLHLPKPDSHKGQNGRLLIIGGSQLFHAASLWALQIASRIVDLVHYASVEENNILLMKLKKEFRNGIVVPRGEIESYIEEDDCILIGPGMLRIENPKSKIQNSKLQEKNQNLREILNINDEGLLTYYLSKYLFTKFPKKKWVIDAGALQMLDLKYLPPNAILIPHHKEFDGLESRIKNQEVRIKMKKLDIKDKVKLFAKECNCTVLLKGKEDIVVSKDEMEVVSGGNAGMTKGGTGDVLAGLVAGLYCRNDAFISVVSASFINKKAGDDLYKKMGYWFNASDLANQIPQTMKELIFL